ncbi:hypothetical protein ACFXHA_36680 [Nocardia sp. NPDC059240]|uniref:hypothetical protein n=1 Tax=Nocardia sp. NPDC059240 TaxID=3346786 RepID=UPI00368D8BA8
MSPLLTLADEWRQGHQDAGGHQATVAADVALSPEFWQGTGGDTMRERHGKADDFLTHTINALVAGDTAARDGHAAITADHQRALGKIDDAERAGYQVAEDGSVHLSTTQRLLAAALGPIGGMLTMGAMQRNASRHSGVIQSALGFLGDSLDHATGSITGAFQGLAALTGIASPDSQGSGGGLRSPDYYSIDFGAFSPWLIGGGGVVTITRNGHVYVGPQIGIGTPGDIELPVVRGGWINQGDTPSADQLDGYIHGWGVTASGQAGPGVVGSVGETWGGIPDFGHLNDYSTEVGGGFGTPGAALTGSYMFRIW